MSKTGSFDETLDFVVDYLKENGGHPEAITHFRDLLKHPDTVMGTAFYNVLTAADQYRLDNSSVNPRYRHGYWAIWDALDFLTA